MTLQCALRWELYSAKGFLPCARSATWMAHLADWSLLPFSFCPPQMLSCTAASSELPLLGYFEINPNLRGGIHSL